MNRIERHSFFTFSGSGALRGLILGLFVAMFAFSANTNLQAQPPVDEFPDYCAFSVGDAAFASGYNMAVNYLDWGIGVDNMDNYLPMDLNRFDCLMSDMPPYDCANYYGYLDMTDEIVIDVFRGTRYDFAVGAGFAGFSDESGTNFNYFSQDLKIYIDFNRDGDFSDAGETAYSYDSDGSSNATYWFQNQILIPSDAGVGLTVMRIVCDYNSNNNISACSNGTQWGEARDFGIRIAPGNDCGATQIVAPTGVFDPGDQEVVVRIKNYADKPLSSARVHWSVNGEDQTPFDWSGGPLEFGETADATVGIYDFQPGKPFASSTISAYTSLPNGRTDEVTSNDACPDRTVSTSVPAGVYKIGCADFDFYSLNHAAEYLAGGGISGDGDVVFELCSGVYDEQVEFGAFGHTGNRLVLRSTTRKPEDVTIQCAPTSMEENYVLKVANTDLNFKLEGITLKNTNTSGDMYGKTLVLDNHLNSVELTNNFFIGVPNAPDGGDIMYDGEDYYMDLDALAASREFSTVWIGDMQPNRVVITDNVFSYGSRSLYAVNLGDFGTEYTIENNKFQQFTYNGVVIDDWDAATDMAAMTDFDVYFNKNEITAASGSRNNYGALIVNAREINNNTVAGFYGYGVEPFANQGAIYAANTGYFDKSLTVDNNEIRNCNYSHGIRVNNYPNPRITNNKVHINSDETSIIRYGIVNTFSGDPDSDRFALIQNNEVKAYGGGGIAAQATAVKIYRNYVYCENSDYNLEIQGIGVNNFAIGYAALNMIAGQNVFGMGIDNTDNYEGLNFGVYYNTIGVNAPGMGSAVAFGSGDFAAKRNMFVNFADASYAGVTSLMEDAALDQNNYYTYGPMFGVLNVETAPEPVMTFEDWQDMTRQDANSTNIEPLFMSETNLRLIQFNEDFYFGEPLFTEGSDLYNEIEAFDWDGEARNGVYYMGVDHIQPEISFIEQPDKIIDCLGATDHQLNVVAMVSFGGVPVYQWQKDGEDIDVEENPSANTAILLLDDLSYDMSGVYRCVVSDVSGAAEPTMSKEVVLYVLEDTKITKQPVSRIVDEGETVMFEVGAHIYDDELDLDQDVYNPEFQWYRGTEPLENDSRFEGVRSSILSIRNIEAADYRDDYWAEVRGYCNTVRSNNFSVLQSTGVDILDDPYNADVCEGATAVFNVEAVPTGSGINLSYSWRKNGVPLVNTPDIRGAFASQLVITNVGDADAGAYDCVVTAHPDAVSETANAAQLTVVHKPVITMQPADVNIETGKTFTLTVEADGDNLEYQWFKNGMSIPGADEAEYTVEGVVEEDAGLYSVKVWNACAYLRSQLAQVTVTTFSVMSATDAQAGGYSLLDAKPNPAGETAAVGFVTPQTSHVRLTLSDAVGNEIAELFNQTVGAGSYDVEINASELGLSSGVYYYTIKADGFSAVKKLVIVK